MGIVLPLSAALMKDDWKHCSGSDNQDAESFVCTDNLGGQSEVKLVNKSELNHAQERGRAVMERVNSNWMASLLVGLRNTHGNKYWPTSA